MHSPLFQIPLCFREIFWLCGKFPKCYLFSKTFSIFIRQNFWWFFFSHQPQISNFPPYFRYFNTFPPISTTLFFPPIFLNSPFTCFWHTLCVFRFPLLLPWCIYAAHNARTGRPWNKVCYFPFFFITQRQASLSTLQSRSARRKVEVTKNRRKSSNKTEDEENDVNSEKSKALVSDSTKEPNSKKKMSKENIDMKEFPNGKKPSIEDNLKPKVGYANRGIKCPRLS